jgi:hypothetical protein
MSVVKIYNKRVGRPMPLLGSGNESSSLIQYTFGAECQKIINCSNETTVLPSEDFCMAGGQYYTASYRALQQKDKSGRIVYNSTVREKPSLYEDANYVCEESGNVCDIISF